ncbi:hypothetical protein AXF42_Ash019559 [Apostasia shenzhenica]|uniref:Uncharacterized protein n=1 Tax=Apostasia shenzhenica TaxID=1088818 RepID=A0A2I0AV28_9ASPA|nr:hypothetical protein AXF42_Ash019559 [Apostasia shenzhenica]
MTPDVSFTQGRRTIRTHIKKQIKGDSSYLSRVATALTLSFPVLRGWVGVDVINKAVSHLLLVRTLYTVV